MSIKEHIEKNLSDQTSMISESQLEEVTAFKKDFLPKLKKANDFINALREEISAVHNAEVSKSSLKSKFEKYQKFIPCVDVEGFEALIDNDIEICKNNVANAKAAVEKVAQNYAKFVLDQQR